VEECKTNTHYTIQVKGGGELFFSPSYLFFVFVIAWVTAKTIVLVSHLDKDTKRGKQIGTNWLSFLETGA